MPLNGTCGMTAENGDQSDQLVSMLSPGHSNLFGNVVALPTVVVTWFCMVTSRSMLVSRLSQLKAVAVSFIVSCLRRSGQRMHMHVPAPARAILEWSGHCRRQCIEAHSADLSARSAEKIFSPSFSDVWMSSRSTLVLCTALSLISAFRVIRDVERKCHDNARFAHITSGMRKGVWGHASPEKIVNFF